MKEGAVLGSLEHTPRLAGLCRLPEPVPAAHLPRLDARRATRAHFRSPDRSLTVGRIASESSRLLDVCNDPSLVLLRL